LTTAPRAATFAPVPPQNPLTRLEQVALEMGRFAEALEAATDLDAKVIRYWQAELRAIAAQLGDGDSAGDG
jgi:hypothetical protein